MTNEQKEKILELLKKNQLGVVSTNSGNGAPQSAVVAIPETPELELFFGSSEESRKNINLAKDSSISIVVGWDLQERKTIQIEGQAQLITDLGERQRIEDIHCTKNPRSNKFRSDPRQQYFKVTPKWIRYSDFSINPQEVWEINL